MTQSKLSFQLSKPSKLAAKAAYLSKYISTAQENEEKGEKKSVYINCYEPQPSEQPIQ